MKRNMTKAEALQQFRELAVNIPRGDEVMRRCAWNDYTDALCKNGQISEKQYESWSNPF